MLLQVKNLTKKFGELLACDDISFEVSSGEIFGIAGPNGAGKTTLFNCISGYYHGTGEIFFNRQNINGKRPHEICKLGIGRSFQIPNIFSTLRIEQTVTVGAYYGRSNAKKDVQEQINWALDMVGLSDKRDLLGKNINLYAKKLTMLAAILATDPKIILLDEPMSGLNVTEINAISSLIKELNDELGMTIIIIEHLMKVLTGLSGRMMIMNYGKKLCIGETLEVCQNEEVIEVYLGATKFK